MNILSKRATDLTSRSPIFKPLVKIRNLTLLMAPQVRFDKFLTEGFELVPKERFDDLAQLQDLHVKFGEVLGVDLEYVDSKALADGSAIVTFSAGEEAQLPSGTYTANVNAGGEALAYECGLNSADPTKIYCFGPLIDGDTAVSVALPIRLRILSLAARSKIPFSAQRPVTCRQILTISVPQRIRSDWMMSTIPSRPGA